MVVLIGYGIIYNAWRVVLEPRYQMQAVEKAKQKPIPAENIALMERQKRIDAEAKAWGTWVVKGRIIQKTYDGLLVQSVGGMTEPEQPAPQVVYVPDDMNGTPTEAQRRASVVTHTPEEWRRIYAQQAKIAAEEKAKSKPVKPLEKSLPIYEGTCLLVDHPREDVKVDGDGVNIKVQYDGEFSYVTVLGARKTVRQFRALDIK